MKPPGTMVQVALVAAVMVGGSVLLPESPNWGRAATWQHMASPGSLSLAHADLERDCAACHTPVRGVDSGKCVLCHAADEDLLQRQPTAFHGSIKSCKECHPEHLGSAVRPTVMDHEALSRIGIRELRAGGDNEHSRLLDYLEGWLDAPEFAAANSPVTALEGALDCANCHLKQDVHFELFGADCGQCHSTSMWTLPQFRHPSPSSRDCAQCHQAPPSHYMGHFKMISATIARKPHATVDQCFECHRSTAWTDIPGVGHYKHH